MITGRSCSTYPMRCSFTYRRTGGLNDLSPVASRVTRSRSANPVVSPAALFLFFPLVNQLTVSSEL